jgi:hypothetical protein
MSLLSVLVVYVIPPRLVSALRSERYEFHKPVSIWIDWSKSARNEEPSSRSAFNSGLASGDSGLQLNLEIALSGVSATVKPPAGFTSPAESALRRRMT